MTANFSTNVRAITLGHGAASFKVARDPKRPFRVTAGGGTITAVGTAFNVQRRKDDDVIVSVSEGIVEVDLTAADHALRKAAPISGADRLALQISRGQEVTYDAEGQMSPVRPADAANTVDWRDGHFRYTRQPLRHVIEDINRYSHRQLILGEAALGDLLYSGTVFTTGADEWVIGLPQTYPQIKVIEGSNSQTLIQTRRERLQTPSISCCTD
jgi:transmembrane sensor